MITIRTVSALEKCFMDEPLEGKAVFERASALKGERFSYQIAFYEDDRAKGKRVLHYTVEGALADCISVCRVDSVPSAMPAYGDCDEYYLRTAPGLYPDLLRPISGDDRINVMPGYLISVWVDVRLPEEIAAGDYPISIRFTAEDGEEVGASVFTLTVADAVLPKQELLFTQWFHGDCLADYYRVEVFSEEHWRIMENFLRTARENGINLILTPIFTPPLDTAVGGERTTIQLVEVEVTADGYRFGFEKLGRWVGMCRRVGIERFEMAHLFTQWGAYHAPKVMAKKDGVLTRIFGWDTDAHGEEYSAFLQAFLPQLRAYLNGIGVDDAHVVYHISDEPGEAQLDSYLKAKAAVGDALDGCTVMDALSEYAYYESGAVAHPICASNAVEPFLEHEVPGLWTYYCCAQGVAVSNRFLAMPSARNRIIGVQMYVHNIAGFLHWGYNFYNNQCSQAAIDPYHTTDAEFFVPSGDAFSVYPAADGTALETIHLVVFTQALQDLRALKLLEERVGREAVLALIREEAGMEITFRQYPHEDAFLLSLREKITERLRGNR